MTEKSINTNQCSPIKEIRPDVSTVDASKRVKSVVDDGPAFSSGVRFGLEGTSANDPDGLAKYFIFPFPLKIASQKGGRIYLGGANKKEWNEKIQELKQYGVVENENENENDDDDDDDDDDEWIFKNTELKSLTTIAECDEIINKIDTLKTWFSVNDEPDVDIINKGSSMAYNSGTVRTNV